MYIEDFKDVRDDFSKITATIYVNRKSQVNIVVGREGCKIKEVGMKSRQKLENVRELIETCHLFFLISYYFFG